jgi:hypothetical protein
MAETNLISKFESPFSNKTQNLLGEVKEICIGEKHLLRYHAVLCGGNSQTSPMNVLLISSGRKSKPSKQLARIKQRGELSLQPASSLDGFFTIYLVLKIEAVKFSEISVKFY